MRLWGKEPIVYLGDKPIAYKYYGVSRLLRALNHLKPFFISLITKRG